MAWKIQPRKNVGKWILQKRIVAKFNENFNTKIELKRNWKKMAEN